MDRELVNEVWVRLVAGKPLADLGLPVTESNQVDLRGLTAPEATVTGKRSLGRLAVNELSDQTVIRGRIWKNLDFSHAKLDGLRLFDCRIEDCGFDAASCRDWRMWGTTLQRTSLRGTDLRKSALGGVDHGKRNSFLAVDFARADLRQTAWVSADMLGCKFVNVAKVDFQGTTFTNCRFEGELDEVLFYRHAFRHEDLPPNDMKQVDFSEAKLHYVEFRGLDMDTVKWPRDGEHLVVNDYLNALDRALRVLSGRADVPAKKLVAILTLKRKWIGKNQKQGLVNMSDIAAVAGLEAANELAQLLGPTTLH
jgi:uncharacterized protein YjbI with pentapeptide repeats